MFKDVSQLCSVKTLGIMQDETLKLSLDKFVTHNLCNYTRKREIDMTYDTCIPISL